MSGICTVPGCGCHSGSTNVVSIESKKPHAVISCHETDGTIRVVPVSLLRDFADGKLSMSQIEECEPLFRAIVRDWLL